MTPRQAKALLALMADLYLLVNEPEPQPEPVRNGQERAREKEAV